MAPARTVREPKLREQVFSRAAVSVRAARIFVAETLSEWSVADRVADVRLCVSELATNAVRHGQAMADDFEVRMAMTRQLVRLTVRNRGTGRPTLHTPDTSSATGRGLLIVSALADDWGAEPEADTRSVWAEFKIGTGTVPPHPDMGRHFE